MQIIPINDTYSQQVTSLLGGQNCQFNLYQKSSDDLYCDVYVNNAPIITGVRCRNLVRIVRDSYLGFVGDVMFLDTQGTTTPPSTGLDPSSPGLGTRYLFCYLSATDLQG
ncbi:hypothetical protein FVF58_09600 [Paraburkholderia panacisoli]|uniref:Cyanophage baseplate Pam3 plug gp18 domain-containing protein n=1 Tax=Paraburkholderia panacisoli TaxID=2603818 RepID=A0A5B0HCN9_9BURK|nr:hypothetical protein FVF58_09600 [Paraburkholderia panacisoli]